MRLCRLQGSVTVPGWWEEGVGLITSHHHHQYYTRPTCRLSEDAGLSHSVFGITANSAIGLLGLLLFINILRVRSISTEDDLHYLLDAIAATGQTKQRVTELSRVIPLLSLLSQSLLSVYRYTCYSCSL